jgi:hypothetical protein
MAEEHLGEDSKFQNDSDASLTGADASLANIDAKDTPGEDTSAGEHFHPFPFNFHHYNFCFAPTLCRVILASAF